MARGFSHRTHFPARAAANAISQCELLGLPMSMTSMSLPIDQPLPVGFDALVAPLVGKGLGLVCTPGADRLEDRAVL